MQCKCNVKGSWVKWSLIAMGMHQIEEQSVQLEANRSQFLLNRCSAVFLLNYWSLIQAWFSFKKFKLIKSSCWKLLKLYYHLALVQHKTLEIQETSLHGSTFLIDEFGLIWEEYFCTPHNIVSEYTFFLWQLFYISEK